MKGDKYYYKDGSITTHCKKNSVLHRLDGPAIEYADGYKMWYKNGKLHRLNGPAKESTNGYKEWWVNDVEYFESEFIQLFNQTKATTTTKDRTNEYKNRTK